MIIYCVPRERSTFPKFRKYTNAYDFGSIFCSVNGKKNLLRNLTKRKEKKIGKTILPGVPGKFRHRQRTCTPCGRAVLRKTIITNKNEIKNF